MTLEALHVKNVYWILSDVVNFNLRLGYQALNYIYALLRDAICGPQTQTCIKLYFMFDTTACFIIVSFGLIEMQLPEKYKENLTF
jgi:hypothetical protein